MSIHSYYNTLLANSAPHPQIYIVCLASQAIGKFHAAWMGAAQDMADLRADIGKFTASGLMPDGTEFEICGYKGFYSLEMGKQHGLLEDIQAKAMFIYENGDLGAVLLTYYEGDLRAAEEAIMDHYETCF